MAGLIIGQIYCFQCNYESLMFHGLSIVALLLDDYDPLVSASRVTIIGGCVIGALVHARNRPKLSAGVCWAFLRFHSLRALCNAYCIAIQDYGNMNEI